MTKFISGCMCAVCAVMLTGCATAGKAEKAGRAAAAGIAEQYLKQQKVKLILDGCAKLDANYDEMVEAIKKEIIK